MVCNVLFYECFDFDVIRISLIKSSSFNECMKLSGRVTNKRHHYLNLKCLLNMNKEESFICLKNYKTINYIITYFLFACFLFNK
jgi:hypothetical protein